MLSRKRRSADTNGGERSSPHPQAGLDGMRCLGYPRCTCPVHRVRSARRVRGDGRTARARDLRAVRGGTSVRSYLRGSDDRRAPHCRWARPMRGERRVGGRRAWRHRGRGRARCRRDRGWQTSHAHAPRHRHSARADRMNRSPYGEKGLRSSHAEAAEFASRVRRTADVELAMGTRESATWRAPDGGDRATRGVARRWANMDRLVGPRWMAVKCRTVRRSGRRERSETPLGGLGGASSRPHSYESWPRIAQRLTSRTDAMSRRAVRSKRTAGRRSEKMLGHVLAQDPKRRSMTPHEHCEKPNSVESSAQPGHESGPASTNPRHELGQEKARIRGTSKGADLSLTLAMASYRVPIRRNGSWM